MPSRRDRHCVAESVSLSRRPTRGRLRLSSKLPRCAGCDPRARQARQNDECSSSNCPAASSPSALGATRPTVLSAARSSIDAAAQARFPAGQGSLVAIRRCRVSINPWSARGSALLRPLISHDCRRLRRCRPALLIRFVAAVSAPRAQCGSGYTNWAPRTMP